MNIKEKIRELCSKNDITFHKLEKELGFGNGYFTRLRDKMPSDRLEKVADYFGISTEELLGGDVDTFTFVLTNDSMSPDLANGSVLIVQPQAVADSGDVVIARQNGSQSPVCRRLMKYRDMLMLTSFNPAYPPEPLDGEILGKVIESRRKW